MSADLPMLRFATPAEWEAWLEKEHADHPDGVVVEMAKKGTGLESIDHRQALELALCFGWIDAQRLASAPPWYRQRFCPRRPRSRWSRINRDAATALIEAGRMHPAGLLEVERARADGRWDAAYEGAARSTVPPDLAAALAADPAALAFFDALSSQNRYAILYRVEEAKRPATRAARIEKYVAMCAAGEVIHP
jgi:uncharacterized protein YdeI (YjbR/CyaY-like superfamily)